MLKKIIYITATGFIFSTGGLQAQEAKSYFLQAYEAYEGGDYSGSLTKIQATESSLGKTNSKIQSLKTLIYNEKGDLNQALEELELYFKTSPDKMSSEYENMLSLYKELKETSKGRFEAGQQELIRKRNEELESAGKAISSEKDLYYFRVAKEAGTLEAYQLFLKKNTTESLKSEMVRMISAKQNELNYETLVAEGIDLMAGGSPGIAAEKFLEAQKIKKSDWLNSQIKEAWGYGAQLSLNKGNSEFYNRNWLAAAEHFRYAWRLNPSAELQKKVEEANDELAYEFAHKKSDAAEMKVYLSAFPKGRKVGQAEGFLFNHYLANATKSIADQRSADTRLYLKEIQQLKSSPHWKIFSEDYYKLVLEEAEFLSSGSKKHKINNIRPAMDYYTELNEGSGTNYSSKIKSLNWKNKEWNRKDIGYLAYRSDATFNDIGLDFGMDKNRGIGLSLSIRMSRQVLASSDFPLNGMEHVKGIANLNFTKKIIYPLWIYAGGGWANYQKIDPVASDPSRGMLSDETVDTFNMETGISLHLKPVYLSVGSSFPYLNEKQNAQLGFVKSPSYVNVAIGFGW